jgi:hypothetical protein
MRRGYDVINAVCNSQAAHLDADVPRFRSVVHLRKNVAVNINHATASAAI